jgi:hypothetical protein
MCEKRKKNFVETLHYWHLTFNETRKLFENFSIYFIITLSLFSSLRMFCEKHFSSDPPNTIARLSANIGTIRSREKIVRTYICNLKSIAASTDPWNAPIFLLIILEFSYKCRIPHTVKSRHKANKKL